MSLNRQKCQLTLHVRRASIKTSFSIQHDSKTETIKHLAIFKANKNVAYKMRIPFYRDLIKVPTNC